MRKHERSESKSEEYREHHGNLWIQEAMEHGKKGALHHQLGIPLHEKIPIHILEHIVKSPVGHHDIIHGHPVTITHLLKKRANFLLNVDRMRR